jgi:hypothetical protein
MLICEVRIVTPPVLCVKMRFEQLILRFENKPILFNGLKKGDGRKYGPRNRRMGGNNLESGWMDEWMDGWMDKPLT